MPRPESRLIAVLLTALVAFGPISTDLYLPALPSLPGAFGTDIATVQLTLSVFLAGFAVGQVLYGPLSDRLGAGRCCSAASPSIPPPASPAPWPRTSRR